MRESLLPTVSSFDHSPPPPLEPKTPGWVDAAMAHATAIHVRADITASATDHLTLLTTSVPQARHMSADEFRAAVHRAYDALGTALHTLEQTAIRFWNYMPEPGYQMGRGLDRYMVFNEGRNAAYRRWLGMRGPFSSLPATATAVGIESDAYVVHCLASAEPGRPVENPRQTSSWRYSHRYGPTPPSFSRATMVTMSGGALLLIGGTASIVGEETVHIGDVSGQIDETLANLAALIAAARGEDDASRPLSHLRDVRIYLTRPDDAAFLRGRVESQCPHLERLEMAVTRLCRPELLVEVEGVAELNRPT